MANPCSLARRAPHRRRRRVGRPRAPRRSRGLAPRIRRPTVRTVLSIAERQAAGYEYVVNDRSAARGGRLPGPRIPSIPWYGQFFLDFFPPRVRRAISLARLGLRVIRLFFWVVTVISGGTIGAALKYLLVEGAKQWARDQAGRALLRPACTLFLRGIQRSYPWCRGGRTFLSLRCRVSVSDRGATFEIVARPRWYRMQRDPRLARIMVRAQRHAYRHASRHLLLLLVGEEL